VFERASRFHDLGLLRPTQQEALGKAGMPYFVGVNYRMNEMTGAVMRAQLRKLETIVGRHRQNARFVRERIEKLPGVKLRRSNDQEGDLGWTVDILLPDMRTRNRFSAAMTAEKIPMGAPSGSVPLPRLPYVASKAAPHPAWPTFNSPRGKEIVYGPACCPRTTAIYSRAATLTIGPKYTNRELEEIVAAIAKSIRAVSA
jgi:8-amino-3,8-dideoxy-alpha-D-manno-octulosonate transaminase